MVDTHFRIINYCQVFCESSLLCSKSHSLTILDDSHVRCFSLPAGGEDFLSACEKLITFCIFFLREALISILHRMTLVKSSAESLPSLPDYPPQEISPKNPLSGWVGGYWGKLSKKRIFFGQADRKCWLTPTPPHQTVSLSRVFWLCFWSQKMNISYCETDFTQEKEIGWSFARGRSIWMIICKKPVHPDDHLQKAGPSGWSFARGRSIQMIICKRPVHPDDYLQKACPSG